MTNRIFSPKLSSLILAAAGFHILTAGKVSGADGFTVRGTLKELFYDGAANILPDLSTTNDYCASIAADGRWKLELRQQYGSNEPMFGKTDIQYLTYDGTNTFFARYTEQVIGISNGAPAVVAITPVKDQVNNAYLSNGNYPYVPFEWQKRLNALWIMYGAGTYIHDSKTNVMPLPWVPARWNLLAFGFRCESELSPTAPYLPSSVKFIRDTKLDLSEVAEMNRPELDRPSGEQWIANWKKQLTERKTEWPDGFLAGELKTSNSTNANGWSIPLKFSLATRLPRLAQPDKVRCLYVGQVTDITNLDSSEQFQPPVTATLEVADSRFHYNDDVRKVDQINYPLHPGDPWPAQDTPRLRQVFDSLLSTPSISARYQTGHIRNKRLVITAIILTISLLFPLLLYREIRRNK